MIYNPWGSFKKGTQKRNVEIIIPIPRNNATDAQLRFENLGSPQTPWPLVHPFASFVPNPTNKPLIPNPTKFKLPTFTSAGRNTEELVPGILSLPKVYMNIEEVRSIPLIKDSFHGRLDFFSEKKDSTEEISGSSGLSQVMIEQNIPLIPVTLPLRAR